MTDRLAELFGAPLDEFVTTRNRIAKELRADGNETEAAEVAGLRKPTTVVWGLDQLARQAPDLIKALGKANDSLRGAGSVADMREASDERLRVVRELVDRAAELLEEAGLGAAESTRERMARTLLATASDPSAEEALRDGRLTAELELSGFGEVALTAAPRIRAAAAPAQQGRCPDRRPDRGGGSARGRDVFAPEGGQGGAPARRPGPAGRRLGAAADRPEEGAAGQGAGGGEVTRDSGRARA